MFAGKSFGKFVAEDLLPGHGTRVYLAHQRNSQELGAYVVKVVSVAETGAADVSAAARRWMDGVSLQDRVAQDWHEVVAPVIERPTKAAEVVEALNSGNVWYVTRRYAGSMLDVLDGLAGNPAAAGLIWRVCSSITRGALAFKQVDAPGGGRRSHGNLKPGNILVSALPLVEGKTEIVVSDPAPVLVEGSAADPARIEEQFERADLVELGKVLFQLVAGRSLPGNWNWAGAWNSPESDVVRWRQVFAKAATQWRSLCQELLEAGTSVKPVSLADIERRLGMMQPRVSKPLLPKILALAAVLAVTGIGTAVFTIWQLRGVIVVQAPAPAGLTAEVTLRNRNVPADTRTGQLTNGVAEFQVKSGNTYEVTLQPTGEFRRLPAPPAQRQPVSPRSRKTNEFFVSFATLKVAAANASGQAVPADLSLGGETNLIKLPATLYLPPTNRQYQLNVDPAESASVYPTSLAILLDGAGSTLTTNVVLQTVIPGVANVNFRADVRLPLTYRFGTNVIELGRDAFRMQRNFQQGETVAIAVQPPHPWPEFKTNWTVPNVRTAEFPREFLNTNTLVQLKWPAETDPDRTEVWVGAGNTAPQRLGSVMVAQSSIFPPTAASYRFVFQRPGYRSVTNDNVQILPGVTNLVTLANLEAIYGFVVIAGNIPGFKVYTNDVQIASAATSNATVNLPPFATHKLRIVFSNDFGILPEQELTARVDPGETNRLSVAFTYVRVEIEPTPTNAMIYRLASNGEAVALVDRRFLQAPNATNRFRVEAEHFVTWERALGSALPGVILQPTPVLIAKKYPVYFEVFPDEAKLEDRAGVDTFTPGTNLLEFKNYTVLVKHPMLGRLTNTFGINPAVTVTQRWTLPAGRVSVATGQDGLNVKIFPDDPALAKLYREEYANEWLQVKDSNPWKTPILNANLPPGGYELVFSDGGESATNRIEIALNQATNVSLPKIVFLPPAYTNSLGMRFVKVPGQSAYISLAPVGRALFNSILDPTAKFPVIRGDRPAVTDQLPDNTGSPGTLPQASLTNMVEFCRLLTQQEAALFRQQLRDEKWRYELPELSDWQSGTGDPGFSILTIPDPNDNKKTVELPEIVVRNGKYYHSEKDPKRTLINVGSASLRQGRTDLGFRVVVRRQAAGQ